jgi:hypothetical protein
MFAWNVFALLLIIGLLSFFSTFISLDSHISKETNQSGTSGGRNIKLAKREKIVESSSDKYIEYLKEKFKFTPKTSPKAKSNKQAAPLDDEIEDDKHSQDHKSLTKIEEDGEKGRSNDGEEGEYDAADKKAIDLVLSKIAKKPANQDSLQTYADDETDTKDSSITSTKNTKLKTLIQPPNTKNTCVLKFKDKCKMNPIVKYWDESSDCYISPLRGASGSSAPIEDRKYVVFQADLGGWNNIRMGLEVVILFAQVKIVPVCMLKNLCSCVVLLCVLPVCLTTL